MQAINQKERQTAFTRFLLFFILTLIITCTAIFFGIKVPLKENEYLKTAIEEQENEKLFNQSFFTKMAETQSLLDSINYAGVNAALVEGRITQKIQEMDAMVQKEQLESKDKYTNIVKNLTNRRDDKKTIQIASSKDQVMAEYEKKIALLEQNRDEWRAQAEKLQLQIQLLNR
jgi:hypothetical protein